MILTLVSKGFGGIRNLKTSRQLPENIADMANVARWVVLAMIVHHRYVSRSAGGIVVADLDDLEGPRAIETV